MTEKTQCRRSVARNGFSLMEVLVALFVLTLGVIGAAGMQLVAMRTAQQSGFESAALRLATEMADKIRMYGQRVPSKDSENPYLALAYSAASDPVPEKPGKLCDANACATEELARYEIYEWKKRIRQSLPGGRATICRDANPWEDQSGSLKWECDASSLGNAPVVIKLGWWSKKPDPDGSLGGNAGGPLVPIVAIAVTTAVTTPVTTSVTTPVVSRAP